MNQQTARTWSSVLLALILIVGGGVLAAHLTFEAINVVLGIAAIADGILILVGK